MTIQVNKEDVSKNNTQDDLGNSNCKDKDHDSKSSYVDHDLKDNDKDHQSDGVPLSEVAYNIMMDVIDSFIVFSNKAFLFYMSVFFADKDTVTVNEEKMKFLKDNQVPLFFMTTFSFVLGSIITVLAIL